MFGNYQMWSSLMSKLELLSSLGSCVANGWWPWPISGTELIVESLWCVSCHRVLFPLFLADPFVKQIIQ